MLSFGIIVSFCVGIYSVPNYEFFNIYFRYGMYRLIAFSFLDPLNKNVISIIILVVCFYFSLLISVFLFKKLCKPIFKGIISVNIQKRNTLIRINFSTVVCLYFLVVDGWIINRFLTLNWYIPENKLALLALILADMAILPVAIFIWQLLMQGRWEKFWGLILKLRNPCFRICYFMAFAIMVLLIILNLYLYIDKKINKPEGPNIILISIDTLRADHLGCYGYEKNITPNIDNFAKEGVLFKNCIAQASNTPTSHASIFTSLIPSHHGLLKGLLKTISRNVLTMGEILRNHYYVLSFNGGGYVSTNFGFGRGFSLYEEYKNDEDFNDIIKSVVGKSEKLKRNSFFIFLHTYEVHRPYSPKDVYLSENGSRYKGFLLSEEINHELMDKINNGAVKINKDDLDYIISMYDAEILSMDEAFSVLIDFLKKEDIYDDSIIIFTSDHGEAFGEHGKIATHGDILYDECLKVPLIIKFPNSKWAGKVIQEQVRSIDILPTIIEELNFRRFSYFEGISLESLIKGEKFEETLFALSQKDLVGYPSSSLRTNRWKWHEDYEERLLFNLENDPLEERDVSSENKEIVEFLENKLNEIINSKEFSRVVNEDIEKVHIDDDLQEQLRSLGYL